MVNDENKKCKCSSKLERVVEIESETYYCMHCGRLYVVINDKVLIHKPGIIKAYNDLAAIFTFDKETIK